MRMCGELWVLLQDIAVRVAVRCCSMSQFRITSRPFSESCKHIHTCAWPTPPLFTCRRIYFGISRPRSAASSGGEFWVCAAVCVAEYVVVWCCSILRWVAVEVGLGCCCSVLHVLQCMLHGAVAVCFIVLQWRWFLGVAAVCVAVCVAVLCSSMLHCVAVKASL